MRIVTKSGRVRGVIEKVLARIPAKDRKVLMAFIVLVRAQRQWRLLPLAMKIDRISAGLFPLLDLGAEGGLKNLGGQIIIVLPCFRLFSEEAILGIAAHELAHALRATQLGPQWYAAMQRNYESEEQEADSIACAWGFQRYVDQRKLERSTVVNPYIQEREERIVRRALRRTARQEEQARRRFAAL